MLPSPGLPPYRGEVFCALQRLRKLCWWERKLLVGPPMPDISKRRARRNVVPGPPDWVLGVGLQPHPGRIYCYQISIVRGGGQDP
jgi:hypothetical protein